MTRGQATHNIPNLPFFKDVEEHGSKEFIPVDVNEDGGSILLDCVAYLFEADAGDIVLDITKGI